jgi:hypothetical protein
VRVTADRVVVELAAGLRLDPRDDARVARVPGSAAHVGDAPQTVTLEGGRSYGERAVDEGGPREDPPRRRLCVPGEVGREVDGGLEGIHAVPPILGDQQRVAGMERGFDGP